MRRPLIAKPFVLSSLHVTLSWLAVHASPVSSGSRLWLAVLATGISIATIFVKQHYSVDVLYGYALAWVAWRLSGKGLTS